MWMQMVINLPDALAQKFNQIVPSVQQKEFLTRLLETALSEDVSSLEKDPIYLAALAAEQDVALNAEMQEWHDACISDGIREYVDMEGDIDAAR
jgi:hypothetical protein